MKSTATLHVALQIAYFCVSDPRLANSFALADSSSRNTSSAFDDASRAYRFFEPPSRPPGRG